MSHVKNWLHCVWGTKGKVPFLRKEIRQDIIGHIKANAKAKGIYIDVINGHTQHMHCLLSLGPDQTLAKVMQLIKGESSFWINKNKLTKYKFEWAVEYFGISISDSQTPKLREYIKNQEEHHKTMTWEEEYNMFLTEYGFDALKIKDPKDSEGSITESETNIT
jgi:REP element-mobilizing transposase RayT